MHGSTGGGWKRNAPALPRQLPTQPSSEIISELIEHWPDNLGRHDVLGQFGLRLRQPRVGFCLDPAIRTEVPTAGNGCGGPLLLGRVEPLELTLTGGASPA